MKQKPFFFFRNFEAAAVTRPTLLLLLAGSLLMTAACGTTQGPQTQTPGAAMGADGPRSLSTLENLYKKNSKNPELAVEYSQALREAGLVTKAMLVLSPFVQGNAVNSSALSEMAYLQLSKGNYAKAEETALRALQIDPQNYRGYHALGIALDAQARNEEAEEAFQKALDLWQGNPATIMNNLALSIAAQGRVDEAIALLEDAKLAAPGKREVERNLRILKTMKDSGGGALSSLPSKPSPNKKAKTAAKPTKAATKPKTEEASVRDEDAAYIPPPRKKAQE